MRRNCRDCLEEVGGGCGRDDERAREEGILGSNEDGAGSPDEVVTLHCIRLRDEGDAF